MAKRTSLMLVAALILVFAVTVVGCGGDDKDSSGSGDNSSQSGESGSKDSGSSGSANDTPANRDAMPDSDWSKWVSPEQIARVIRHLVSQDSEVTSGAAVPVYGRA